MTNWGRAAGLATLCSVLSATPITEKEVDYFQFHRTHARTFFITPSARIAPQDTVEIWFDNTQCFLLQGYKAYTKGDSVFVERIWPPFGIFSKGVFPQGLPMNMDEFYLYVNPIEAKPDSNSQVERGWYYFSRAAKMCKPIETKIYFKPFEASYESE